MIRVMSYLEKKHKVGGEMGLAVIEICFDSYLFFSPPNSVIWELVTC